MVTAPKISIIAGTTSCFFNFLFRCVHTFVRVRLVAHICAILPFQEWTSHKEKNENSCVCGLA
jgi:hypothetical protein